MAALSIPYADINIHLASSEQERLANYNTLILQHQDDAFNLAHYLLGNPDAAEDITQQAFINAYLHFDTFRGTQFRSWLMKIVKNACFDELRRQKRHRTFSLDEMESDDGIEPEWDHLASQPVTPEQVVERTQSASQIEAALCRLEESFRAVLILVDIQEMDYLEVAQVLGIPIGTVKSRLARARRQLRALLPQ